MIVSRTPHAVVERVRDRSRARVTIVGLAPQYLPQMRQYQSYTRWLLIAYTGLTIIAWAIVTGFDLTNPIAILTKLIEIALIVCLFIEGRR